MEFRDEISVRRGTALLCATVVLCIYCLLFWPFLHQAMPLDEDWAFTAASRFDPPITWLQQGFAYFFVGYPEWDSPGTHLVRPLGSALYALVYALGGDHRVLLILLYAAHAVCVALVWQWASTHLKLAPAWAWFCAVIAALSPALLSIPVGYQVAPALQYPVYGLEIWCALLMMLAWQQLMSGAIWGYTLVAVLALAMKESALPLPLAALLCTGLWWQSGRARANCIRAFAIVAPLLLWLLVRLFVFTVDGNITMVADDAKHLAVSAAKAALNWPTLLYRDAPRNLVSHWGAQGFGAVLLPLIGIGLNLVFWIVLVTPVLRAFRLHSVWRWQGWLSLTAQPLYALGALAASNLVFALVVGGFEFRYGYLFTLLGPLSLLGLCLRHSPPRAAALALIYVAVAVVSVADIQKNRSDAARASHAKARQASVELQSLIKALPSTVATVYLVNDVTLLFSNAEAFRQIVEVRPRLVRINSVSDYGHAPCSSQERLESRTELTRKGDQLRLWMEPSRCYNLWFYSSTLPLIIPLDANQQVQRGELRYTLPQAQTTAPGLIARTGSQRPGRQLRVDLPYAADAAWIYFDFATERYQRILASEIPVQTIETAP